MPKAAAAVLAVSLALLAGCGGDPKPKFSHAPDPTPSAPTTSPAAKPERAEEFLQRWQDASNMMQIKGDATSYRRLSSKKCDACNNFIQLVTGIYKAGGYIHTRGNTLTDVVPVAGEKHVFTAKLRSTPTDYRAGRSKPEQHLKGGVEKLKLVLGKQDGAWVVLEFTEVES